MDKQISNINNRFDDFKHIDENGQEFWYARELQILLKYSEWRHFLKLIEKTQESLKNTNEEILDHFVSDYKMVDLGSGSEREIHDIKLTRFACYLIAQNGDPRKEEIALAQQYFAIQTRRAELFDKELKERIKERKIHKVAYKDHSKLIKERVGGGYPIIENEGNKSYYGGLSTNDMKETLEVQKGMPLADKLNPVVLAYKNAAMIAASYNIRERNLNGFVEITKNYKSTHEIARGAVIDSTGTRPEDFPPEEDIKKLMAKEKIKIPETTDTSKNKLQQTLF